MAQSSTKSSALWVLRRLRAAGHEALLAGGCVRDMLLGVRPTDYDVATDATPQQVRRLFRHVLLVGAKFGVAMVIHKGSKVEVTTFRSDSSYSDGRRPDAVTFSSPRQDAQRRDFTINGLFYDPAADEVIDYVGGQADMKRRVIRTIGPPRERFAEDYLRMIRAVRFAVRLDFEIAPSTEAAVRLYAPRISAISGERIFDELGKMLARRTAGQAVRKLAELGLAEAILPELFAREGAWERAEAAVQAVAGRADTTLALAALLCWLPAAEIRRILRRWGASNELRDSICWIAGRVDLWPRAAELPLADFKRLLANPSFQRLARLWRFQERRATGRASRARRIARRAGSIPPAKISPKPFISGSDLKGMGLSEGPELGRILRTVYNAQLNEEVSTRRSALAQARQLIRRREGKS